jgi:hypothetical protein
MNTANRIAKSTKLLKKPIEILQLSQMHSPMKLNIPRTEMIKLLKNLSYIIK